MEGKGRRRTEKEYKELKLGVIYEVISACNTVEVTNTYICKGNLVKLPNSRRDKAPSQHLLSQNEDSTLGNQMKLPVLALGCI